MTKPPLRAAILLGAALALAACGDDGASSPTDTADISAPADTIPADTAPGDVADAADTAEPPAPALVDLVDPFVGTGTLLLNFGAEFPGPKLPFGMVALSPDTDGFVSASSGVAHAGGYLHNDTVVLGFSHIHLAGTGVGDYGNLMVVPAAGAPTALLAPGFLPNLPLDHEREAAEPGYYRLATDDVTAELTATLRAGVHRYTFSDAAVAGSGGAATLLFDVTHAIGNGRAGAETHVTVDVDGEIRGMVRNIGDFSGRFGGFDLYFVAVPSRDPVEVGTWDAGGYVAGRAAVTGTKAGVALAFDVSADPVVELRVGVSFVDEVGARENLEAEAFEVPFDTVRARARAAWEDALGVVTVEGGSDTRRRLLYTALYHAQLMPTLLTDVDGRYRGLDQAVHETGGDWLYYSDFSLWDTYRTFHPLASLLWPERQRDFLRSLLRMGEEGGAMPVWPLATGETGSMVGTSADVVFGDAVGKLGADAVDWDAAYAALAALATGPAPEGKPGRDDYAAWAAHEYVPADMAGGSVSKTLEYAHDDFCLARVAEAVDDADGGALFAGRAGWWKHLWDDARAFLAPRDADGTIPAYDAEMVIAPYVEGTAWQYLFMVPHDVPGLVALIGGEAAFTAKLGTFMREGRAGFAWEYPTAYYYHGNEPDLVAPWLFGFGGRPELTRYWTTWVADTAYALEPWGLVGNDDGGTLSSWYVFAAMGLYPLTCTGEYALSAPLFDAVTVHRAAGDVVITRGADAGGPVRVDGVATSDFLLPHAAIAGGAAIELPPAPASDE
ncbi:MAG: GH92 family glycosyl hydrolase [Myxococcales bacterium]|nr:GH92 family glycosyl hydrolase [Myxococcales bacterium]MCB9736903.1 glycoside hydrolase family 92 protein [Deltaproteobacteria bacterium]